MEKKTTTLSRMLSRVGRMLRALHVTIMVVVTIAIFLLPSIAGAQEAAPPTALSKLSTALLDILVPVFVALVGSLVSWALLKFKEKTGLVISDATAGQWSSLAEKAALRGAEYARNKVKESTDGRKIPGPEVLEVAASWAIDMGRELKLPEMARDKLKGLIEAHLFKLRQIDELNMVNIAAATSATVDEMNKLSKI